ncbi:MAG: response regulator [Elusimicrobiota bacterium]
MRILLAEDDRTMSRIAALSLSKKGGHEVVCVGDGAEAVRRAADLRPDLILLDDQMPVMAGPEACRRLKADDRTKGIPVIFLTARSGEDEARLYRDLGAAGMIRKPFNAAGLSERVRAILSESGGG